MAIVQFTPAMTEGSLATGFTVPPGTVLRGQIPRGEVTACQFRTAHELTLWPIEIAEARYAPFAPDLPLNTLGLAEPVQAVLRLKLHAAAPFTFDQLAMDRLNLFLSGRRRGGAEALRAHPRERARRVRRAAGTPRAVVRVARPRCDSARGLLRASRR